MDALRERARRSPVALAVYKAFHRVWRNAGEQLEFARLRRSRRRVPPRRPAPELVVSMTSFPARIRHAWIPIETIFRQDLPVDRIVLVLAEDEFPTRHLPRPLLDQVGRGLEIIWTPSNARSHNKLLPTRLAYPSATIVTVDDDARYEPWAVSRLVAAARRHPGTIVGHRGWEVDRDGSGFGPYVDWEEASDDTPADEVFLTGVGGILYPPDLLPIELLTDAELATSLCPTADDVWFWAVARVAGVPAHCTGLESYRPLRQQARTPELLTINRDQGQNDVQLARVVAHFEELRTPD